MYHFKIIVLLFDIHTITLLNIRILHNKTYVCCKILHIEIKFEIQYEKYLDYTNVSKLTSQIIFMNSYERMIRVN